VPINKLPFSFRKEIHDHQRAYSITMLMNDEKDSKVVPCSGTLAQINGYKGIITARHVWDEARKHEFLLTLVGRGNYAFDTRFLTASTPKVAAVLREFDVAVPDIAFIRLSEKHSSDLEASGKAFFNIDKRINAKSYLIDTNQGYWTIFGNPNEWLDIGEKSVSSFIYGTGISKQFEEGGWDYFVMRLDIDANSDIPRDFSGMSGGGIWWTRWCCDERLERFVVENRFEDIIVAGVSFFQTNIHERRLIGHGPKSIYELLYQHVSNTI
jgi:hypothetical protein